MSDVKFICFTCEKEYSTNSNLLRHMRQVHREKTSLLDSRRKIHCVLCNEEFKSKQEYEQHLMSSHDITLTYEEYEFDTAEECYSFKKKIEAETCSFYSKKNACQSLKGCEVSTFYCHRSGYYSKRGNRKRRHKNHNVTNKINSFCPSQIKMIDMGTKFKVIFCKTHLCNTNDLGQIYVNNLKKENNDLEYTHNLRQICVQNLKEENYDSELTDELEQICSRNKENAATDALVHTNDHGQVCLSTAEKMEANVIGHTNDLGQICLPSGERIDINSTYDQFKLQDVLLVTTPVPGVYLLHT